MISENQFLIGHLSPKLFNHLGFNEIYQDPRQNFYLCRLWISWLLCQAPLQGLIPFGSLSTTNTFSSITHYSYYQEVSRYSSWLHYGLHITPHRINSNSDIQFLAHFWEIPCNLLLSPNWSEVQLIILEPTAKLKRGPNLKIHAKILHHSLWQPRRPIPVFSRVLTSYQASLKMSLYKASYDQRCRTPLSLSQNKDH